MPTLHIWTSSFRRASRTRTGFGLAEKVPYFRAIQCLAVGTAFLLTPSLPSFAGPGDPAVSALVTQTAPGETTNLICGPNGFVIVQFILLGAIVSSVESSDTCDTGAANDDTGDTGGGNDDTGNAQDVAEEEPVFTGVGVQDAANDIDGSASAFLPQTINGGDVSSVYQLPFPSLDGLPLRLPKPRKEQADKPNAPERPGNARARATGVSRAIENPIPTPDEDGQSDGRACDKCKEELAALEAEHARVVAALFEEFNKFQAILEDDERAIQVLNNELFANSNEDSEQDIIARLIQLAESEGLTVDQIDAALAQAREDGERPAARADYSRLVEEARSDVVNAEQGIDDLKQRQEQELARFASLAAELDKRRDHSKPLVPLTGSTKELLQEFLEIAERHGAAGNFSKPSTSEELKNEDIFEATTFIHSDSVAQDQQQSLNVAIDVLKERRDEFTKLQSETSVIFQLRRNIIDKLDEVPARAQATRNVEELQDRERQLQDAIKTKKAICASVCSKASSKQSSLMPESGSDGRSRRKTHATGYAFSDARQGHAQRAIDRTVGTNRQPGFFVSGRDRRVNARFDLRQWRHAYGDAKDGITSRINAAHTTNGLSALFANPKFNLFASFGGAFGENKAGGLGQDSSSYGMSGGVSYLVIPNLNLGVAGRFGKADIDSARSQIDASTWGIAGFAQTQIIGINLQATAAWSRTDIASLFNNVGVITDADTVTTAFSGQVTASTSFAIANLSISPSASISYIGTERDAFALSDGQVAPGQGNDLVVFGLGSSFGTTFDLFDGGLRLSPSVGFGVSDTARDLGNPSLTTSAGLGIAGTNGISGNLGVGFSGVTGDTRNISFNGGLTIPLN